MAGLKAAFCQVVDDDVSKHVAERVGPGNAQAGLSDDHAEFGLVIELAAGLVGVADPGLRSHDRLRHFRKDNGRLGNRIGRRRRAAVKTAARELMRVIEVVLADANDVAPGPGNGRQHPRARERARLSGLQRVPGGLIVLDEPVHVRQGGAIEQQRAVFAAAFVHRGQDGLVFNR
ncbi:hypothetical protein D9M72_524560 [compost metagenome]